jgi:methionyl-tRNA formyltransferase
MLVQIIVDNPNSWMIPYAQELVEEIQKLNKGYKVLFTTSYEDIKEGELLFLLSCENNQRLLFYFLTPILEFQKPKG